MDELERQLRAAMASCAQAAPPGLMDAVRRRNSRHRKRVMAGSVAAVGAIVLAVVPITHPWSGSSGRSGALENPATATASPRPAAIGGTIRLTCDDGNPGELDAGIAADALRIGPLRLAGDLDESPSVHLLDVEVANGATVTLKVTASSLAYLQLTDGFYSGGADPLPSGDTGITFVACPSGGKTGAAPNGSFTVWYLGFNLQVGRSGTADAWIPGSRNPIPVVFRCTRLPCHLT